MSASLITANSLSGNELTLVGESIVIPRNYQFNNPELSSKVQQACDYIRENKDHLINQFSTDPKKVFKISKTQPDNFSIYLARDRFGEIHFFINLGKRVPFNNEGNHKVLTHALKYNDGTLEKWVLAKMPLKDDLKKTMATSESRFLSMFPDAEEMMQTDLIDILPTAKVDKQHIFMPLFELGSLKQALNKKHPFSSEERQQIFLDIANAVATMHEGNTAFRDIKPENILLYKKDNLLRAKLTDFGLSSVLSEGEAFKFNASPYVFSPEMLELRAANKTHIQKDDVKPCDIWALGLTYYQVYFGVKPYDDAYKISRQVKDHNQFKVDIENWLKDNFPEPANKTSMDHLIYEMLSIDPQKRPNIEQVLHRIKSNG